MYFYTLTYSDWEEFAEKIYISDIEYSQSDFEDIILQAYEKRCYEIMEKDSDSLCYPDIFFTPDCAIFDRAFDVIMKDFGFIRSHPVPTARMDFGRDNKFNDLINKRFNDLIIDDSCKEDCWRLKEEDGSIDTENMLYCKQNCIITKRGDDYEI